MTVSKMFAVAALACGVAAPALAHGDPWDPNYEPPRMPDGTPSFEGIWTNASQTVLERPDGVDALVLTEAQAEGLTAAWMKQIADDKEPLDPNAPPPSAGGDTNEGYDSFWIDPGTEVARIDGEYRSSWIVEPANGKLPWAGGGGRAIIGRLMRTGSGGRFDNPEARSAGERCTVGYGGVGGAPMLNVLYNNNYQFVQSPEAVAIRVEMNHNTRMIRMDDEHMPDNMPRWLGDSIGRWDGDTLVVDTVNFHPSNAMRGAIRHFMAISPDAHVTERFTRKSDDEILYEFTVDDPALYSQPWTAQMVFVKSDGPIYEYACHEGNYSLPGILAGARKEEADAASSSGGGSE